MKKALNYLGQLRIYSLADLITMLRAVSKFSKTLWGGVLLWIGFLVFLESLHKDKGREPVNQIYAWISWLIALFFLRDSSGISGLYVIFSILYSLKKQWYWARFSPLLRGLQTICMLVLVSPWQVRWYWLTIAWLLIVNRNFWGDARDTLHDKEEKVKTWPVKFKMKERPFAHLICTLGTSTAWWMYACDISLNWLVTIFVIEVATYWMTPRQSNKKAAQELHKILQLVWG